MAVRGAFSPHAPRLMPDAWPHLETWLWNELGIDTTAGWRDLPSLADELAQEQSAKH